MAVQTLPSADRVNWSKQFKHLALFPETHTLQPATRQLPAAKQLVTPEVIARVKVGEHWVQTDGLEQVRQLAIEAEQRRQLPAPPKEYSSVQAVQTTVALAADRQEPQLGTAREQSWQLVALLTEA